jgi:hypothetical protein
MWRNQNERISVMSLEVAAHAGFCMGVRRAVEKAEEAAEDLVRVWRRLCRRPR